MGTSNVIAIGTQVVMEKKYSKAKKNTRGRREEKKAK
jgi:hypothetical protein